jgi:hypothetical protein
VKCDIYPMMSGCPVAKELAIQHVGHPREWMPVAGMESRECPSHTLPAQALKYFWIVSEVLVVIEVEKAGILHWPVCRESNYHQKNGDQKALPHC